MKVHFFNEDIDFPTIIKRSKVKEWVVKVLQTHQKKLGAINVIFTSEERILETNRQFLQHDYYTDIITFDYCEGDTVSGDLFISVDTVKSNADKIGTLFEEELHRVVIHGVLHLVGFKDKSPKDEAQMRQEENKALAIWSTIV